MMRTSTMSHHKHVAKIESCHKKRIRWGLVCMGLVLIAILLWLHDQHLGASAVGLKIADLVADRFFEQGIEL